MKVYVDTNILVDFVCNRQGFSEDAKKFFAHGYIGEYELMTSALSIVNAVYIGHKYKHDEVKECLVKVTIVTRNKKDFMDSTIPVYTVGELFGVLNIK